MQDHDGEKGETKEASSKSKTFWNLFLTGGWTSFNQEWRSSKSILHTILMFLIPLLLLGVFLLLAILAANVFN